MQFSHTLGGKVIKNSALVGDTIEPVINPLKVRTDVLEDTLTYNGYVQNYPISAQINEGSYYGDDLSRAQAVFSSEFNTGRSWYSASYPGLTLSLQGLQWKSTPEGSYTNVGSFKDAGIYRLSAIALSSNNYEWIESTDTSNPKVLRGYMPEVTIEKAPLEFIYYFVQRNSTA